MTQLTRRNVLLLAVVMAVATTFVAYLFLTRQQVNALSRDDKTAVQTMVVVARQEVRPLQLLRSEWFTVKQVKADGVPRDAVATPGDLKGKVALVTMAPGQVVTERQVAAKSPDIGLAFAVKPPLRAVTVVIDPIIGVAGFPKPGNHVDVLATFQTDYGWVTRTVLQDIEILAMGSDLQEKEVDPSSGQPRKAVQQVTATLAVLPGEAERLILAESRGKLRLALRAVDDTTYRSHTGAIEKTVTGYTPQPKNPVTPMTTAPKMPPVAERFMNDADRALREMIKHPMRQMSPPPLLPPVGYAPGDASSGTVSPAPKPEGPDHVITVIHATTPETVKFKHEAKHHAPDASPSPEEVPAAEAR